MEKGGDALTHIIFRIFVQTKKPSSYLRRVLSTEVHLSVPSMCDCVYTQVNKGFKKSPQKCFQSR